MCGYFVKYTSNRTAESLIYKAGVSPNFHSFDTVLYLPWRSLHCGAMLTRAVEWVGRGIVGNVFCNGHVGFDVPKNGLTICACMS